MKPSIVLYGTGLEGEKFYWKYRNKFEIEYCIDRNCDRSFHGIRVYSIDEVKGNLKKYFIIIAAVGGAYAAIEEILIDIGLKEFDNYLGAFMVGRKLAILYGNCHMEVLEEYLMNNPFFNRTYVIRRYFIAESDKKCPTDLELAHCKLLIGQDIWEKNSAEVPSIDILIKRAAQDCRCITIPNLYLCNFLFPQVKGFNYEYEYEYKHLNKDAIDLDLYSEVSQNIIKSQVRRIGYGDTNIERMYSEGKSCEDIVSSILEEDIYDLEEIRNDFEKQMQKIKEREKKCSIKISDFMEENYQKYQLFYDPAHPTEFLICEKGKRILKLLNIPAEEDTFIRPKLGFLELFIYGCVKRALGLQFEQKYIRKNFTGSMLFNHQLDIREYVADYIAWVCEDN